jgi:hypothetical protein
VIVGVPKRIRGPQDNSHGYKPNDGFVADSQTAVKIAEAVLIPLYGESKSAPRSLSLPNSKATGGLSAEPSAVPMAKADLRRQTVMVEVPSSGCPKRTVAYCS